MLMRDEAMRGTRGEGKVKRRVGKEGRGSVRRGIRESRRGR
jgi:hypothetical protein